MTNYNEKLEEALDWQMKFVIKQADLQNTESEKKLNISEEMLASAKVEAKQAITSLIKELVAEAKPYRETIIDKWNKDRADEVKATNAAMNAWADIFEQNLLKALEEL